MARTLNTTTHVLPGRRIVVDVPGFEEGSSVNVQIASEKEETPPVVEEMGILDFLNSLPRRKRTPEYWAELERSFQEERDSWDR